MEMFHKGKLFDRGGANKKHNNRRTDGRRMGDVEEWCTTTAFSFRGGASQQKKKGEGSKRWHRRRWLIRTGLKGNHEKRVCKFAGL